MYREGFVTAEAFANESEADSHQMAFNDQVVFYPWFLNYGDFVRLRAETARLHPHAEWGLLPPLGDGIMNTGRGWSGLFVSRNVSNPEAAARFLTWVHSTEGRRAGRWGREGIDYTVGADGVPVFSEEFITVRGEGRFDEVFNGWFYFGTSAIEELYGHVAGLDEATMAQISAHGRNVLALPEIGISQPTSASDEGIILARLTELRRTHEAAIIFSDSDAAFEAAFDGFMHALEVSGVQQLNDYMSNAIRETRAALGW
jgi:putative aldouronate transport system substrate-binding protein